MNSRFPDIDWWCDRFGAYLNDQDCFDDYNYTHKCTECGHKTSNHQTISMKVRKIL